GGAYRLRPLPPLPHRQLSYLPEDKDHRRRPRWLLRRVHRDARDEPLASRRRHLVRSRRDPRSHGERLPHRAARHQPRGRDGPDHGLRTNRAVRGGNLKAAGASRVIASDVNARRLALAKTMGAHDAVQPGDAKAAVDRATGGLGVDVVLEMSGIPAAVHQAFALVRGGGRVQMLGIPAKPIEIEFATEIIFKWTTIYGVVGRRVYDTWIQ